MTMEPTVPKRMRKLPSDHRGFVVPRFVTWLRDGKPVNPGYGEPDFRVADTAFMVSAMKNSLCWICGERLGAFLCYVIGPMCAVNRTTSEPPCHRECATYALQVCPFLSRPKMRRNDKDMPEHQAAGGVPLGRNPGMSVLWIERTLPQPYQVKAAQGVNAGLLFQLHDPVEVEWWHLGRLASRKEADEALDRGAPAIRDIAIAEGAVDVFDRMLAKARTYLPRQP